LFLTSTAENVAGIDRSHRRRNDTAFPTLVFGASEETSIAPTINTGWNQLSAFNAAATDHTSVWIDECKETIVKVIGDPCEDVGIYHWSFSIFSLSPPYRTDPVKNVRRVNSTPDKLKFVGHLKK
jgi:hypothetical protein